MEKHIVFTGGGTGGHVYPALAIIDILQLSGYKVSWIGSKKGIEKKIIDSKNIDFYHVPSGKLRRYFSILNFIDVFKVFFGFIKSIYILKKIKPDLLFSKGGYVTVPPVVAAKLLKIHSMTHESDFDPGLATKINSRFVDNILVPYKETRDLFSEEKQLKTIVTGNPVRRDFFNPDKNKGLEIMSFKNRNPIILALGGSLGAKEINDLLINNRDQLTPNYNVYHQMGENNFEFIDEDGYKTVPFIHSNMADLIEAADIVISRSGAGAIWEFITVGTPSILIPLTVGTRGDQVRNAKYFNDKGAAYILMGEDVNISNLLSLLKDYSKKGVKDEMIQNAKALGQDDCAMDIFDLIRRKA